MTQTILLGGKSGRIAGIILRNSSETEEPDRKELSGGKKVFMELLFPAGTEPPETGTPLLILPQGRTGNLVRFRITGSNAAFCRVMAAVRLNEQS